MTTIGSTSYYGLTLKTYIEGLWSESSDKAAGGVAKDVGSPSASSAVGNLSVSEVEAVSQALDAGNHGDTDTFIYDKTGKLAEPAHKPKVYDPASHFKSVHEENQFVRDATSEELAEVYAPETVTSILSARETRDEAAEVTRQMMARMKRENPEFVANSFKGQAQDIVGRIKQTVEQLNMYQERVNSTHDKPAWLQALNESWVERFKGNLLDLFDGLNSIVSVSGDLVKQRDDGTFTLSNFSLSYDGVVFLQHQE
jgi:hypothetical protein